MFTLSIVTPCYNEEDNIVDLHEKVKNIVQNISSVSEYEHIFIDNASTDSTPQVLKKLAQENPHVKVILNARNFGHIRSPYHGLLQAKNQAIMLLVADFQDPPELIPQFIEKYQNGAKIVVGVKSNSDEPSLFFFVRKIYYRTLSFLAEIEIIQNFTGFGLYDKSVINLLKNLEDPYPFFRGLITEIGIKYETIFYSQPVRKRGITKNNFYTLYDIGILGITSHSKKPLRLTILTGFALAIISFLCFIFYFAYKLLKWDEFNIGIAPLVIGLFFFSSIQLIFLGVVGEYIGNIYTKVMNRPLVVEKERINFE